MKDIFPFVTDRHNKVPESFSSVQIQLASPEKIQLWSQGEVKKPETINYRTFKPEKDGLFCAKIFGPVKDYECLCGKYKRMKHRGLTCEKCGVEVILSKVRRERLGHINLCVPVAHIWFMRSLPSRIGNLLNLTLKELEKVLYCESYAIGKSSNPAKYPPGKVFDEEEYYKILDIVDQDPENPEVVIGMGAEIIKVMLSELDLETLSRELRQLMIDAKDSEAKRKKYVKQLRVVEAFLGSNNKPEWMVLDNIPVIPPDLRPLVPLEGGRFATSDLNDLYRRVINRNNRLLRLTELRAPEIIIRNEKRMLQEAVDALFDNGRRGKVITGTNKRPLKSLSDMIKGKQGRFRMNLLGKRVDYSGRSVIVVGPELKLHQCGLPKKMALELFKPFIFKELIYRGLAGTIKSAKKMVEMKIDEVWDILDFVIKEHPILLNRAPTLHRLGVQAFEPVLIEGKAIRLHPLVCFAFNADFDGDQMAVHVPLSVEAQLEARALMMSTNNILSPASGHPVINPTQDIVLGVYYMTRSKKGALGEGTTYSDRNEARIAYDNGAAELHAEVKLREGNKIIPTTVGCILLSEILPEEIPFDYVNKIMDKKGLANLISEVYRNSGQKKTILLADRLRSMGFEYATKSGLSIAIGDMKIPERKTSILEKAQAEVQEITQMQQSGYITDGERKNKVIDTWQKASNIVAKEMMENIKYIEVETDDGKIRTTSFNSIYMMADSGARGSSQQIRQLAGMRGLMAKPSGDIIETPITANFREGLSILQYFISTHGARKGLADTALKTANSGYLTRRLVDVAQDYVVTEWDCGTLDGVEVNALTVSGETRIKLSDRILGRVALEDIIDPFSNDTLVEANELIDEEKIQILEDASHIESIRVRSPITCQVKRGVCGMCYGRDLARGHMVNMGEAVGVIAAQSIGEPGTQLTMRTFHIGGAASGAAEQSYIENEIEGAVEFRNLATIRRGDDKLIAMNRKGYIIIKDNSGREREKHSINYGAEINVDNGSSVKPKTRLCQWDPFSRPIITEIGGDIKFGDIHEGLTMTENTDEKSGYVEKVIIESSDSSLRPRISIKDSKGQTLVIDHSGRDARYPLPVGAHILVQETETVNPGDIIAKIPRETQRNKDITGGLPRVSELFEARKPKEKAIISEIDGEISISQANKGKRKVTVTPPKGMGESREYVIQRNKHISVQEGDFVQAGEPLMDGDTDPHDILKVSGEQALAAYLVGQIQEVYNLQGVTINDKHIEVIVSQMLRWVKVVDPGSTKFLTDEVVERRIFEEENDLVLQKGNSPASGDAVLSSITKAALSIESFISAASFQETTKVLTEAAICGKIDTLNGLKENVIMGRLVPAGTGLKTYRSLTMKIMDEFEENMEDAAASVSSFSEEIEFNAM